VTESPEDEEKGRARRIGRNVAKAARRLDTSPALVTGAKLVRELLPGDSQFGDPLSTAGAEQPQVVGRRLADLTDRRPGVLREAGLSALQVWQAVAEAQGRGDGKRELAIVFTDLVGFSDWALAAGDDAAVDLLRDVGRAIEPAVRDSGGEVVKRLGDGMMAVFDDPHDGLRAVSDARERLRDVEIQGYRPCFRAGMHVGKPRKIGGDYLGVDVNIAARVAEQASGDELLVSGPTLERLDPEAVRSKRKKRRVIRVKGVPRDLAAYAVEPA
jgi:adenylate cyclase